MKTVKNHNALGEYTFVAAPALPKLCRHRRRDSSGRCINCGMHRDPMTASGLSVNTLPSTHLAVRI